MSSTNFTIGFGNSSKPSSKVLRPPGGGSSDIFGNDIPATPRSAKNHMASNIFGSEQNSSVKVNGDARRAQKNGGDSYSRLFGEPERPFTSGNNHMKSSIPIGGGSPTKNGNGTTISSSSSSSTNGGSHYHHQNGNGNKIDNNGTTSSTSSEYQNGVSKTENYEETENISQKFAQAPTNQSVETSVENNNNNNSNFKNNNISNDNKQNNENNYYENVTTTNISTDNNLSTRIPPQSQSQNNDDDDYDTKNNNISQCSQKYIIQSDINNINNNNNNNEQNNDENNSLKTIPEVDNDQMSVNNQINERTTGRITTNIPQNDNVNIINNNNNINSYSNNNNQQQQQSANNTTIKNSVQIKKTSAELSLPQVNQNNINMQNGDHYTKTRSGSNKSKKHNEFSSPRRDENGRPIDSNGVQIPISHRLTNMNNPNRSPRSYNSRNPVTGLGVERTNYKPRKWADHKDGNPVTGEGYKPAGGEINTSIPCLNGANQVINKNRIPPGGFSSGLW